MTTKQEILAYVKQNGFVYPKEKVILLFTLCGGAVGGFILGLAIVLFFITGEIGNNTKFFSVLSEILFFIVGITGISILVGGIPALLTGIYLAVTEFIITNKKDYLSLLLIGGIITIFICLILMLLIITNEGVIDWNATLILLILFLTGGISSMICGKLFLPKLPKDFEK